MSRSDAPVVLTLNAGSSSVKFALHPVLEEKPSETPTLSGQVSGLGGEAALSYAAPDEPAQRVALGPDDGDHEGAWRAVFEIVEARLGGHAPAAIGHRVVHGGADFAAPVLIDGAIYAKLETFAPLAPGHQPHNLAGVRAARSRWPNAPQVACFDTAFHRTQSRLAQEFALPRRYAEQGVIRYGFHGLSYDYIAHAAPAIIGEAAHGRMIVAHLGHGVSMCAMRDGRSVSTTMGFSALDGLPMGKRCGAIDPGVLLHLMAAEGYDRSRLEHLLYKESGLFGLSGVSDDMRALEASDAPEAAFAIDYFIHRCAHAVGGLAADLGGLDALVFTAGIGEHSARVRAGVLERLAWLGLRLDDAGNASHGPCLTLSDSAVSAWVIPTNEELTIARAVATFLSEAA